MQKRNQLLKGEVTIMIKLIALDIDDTLLSSEGRILASTKESLKKAIENDVKVVLCSGRPMPGVRPFLNELGINTDDQYVITYNGSVIESATGRVVNKFGISNAEYRHIDEYAQQHKLQYNVLDEDGEIYTSNTNISRITVIQAWENNAGLLIRTPDELGNDFSIVKAVFVGEVEELNQIELAVVKEFGSQYYVVRAADNFLEVMNASASKGAALEILAAELGIDAEDIIVFGDEQNDISMFKFAGHAIAMGNGSKLAKSYATFITDTNDNDGIAKVLNNF